MGIGSAAGITTGATGNVQVTGARTYSSNASYIYNGDTSQAVGDGLPASVTNLTIANTGPDGPTPTQDNTVTGNSGQAVTGTLTVSDGVYESHSDYTDVVINSGGTLTLTGPTTVSGNWTNNGGTLGGNFTVTFDGVSGQTIAGNTTFYGFNKSVAAAQTMFFTAGSTTTVSNNLTFAGAASNLLSLRSTSDGSYWNLVAPSVTSASYVDVKDSNNTGTNIATTNSTDSGHNVGWSFNPATVTVTFNANGGTGSMAPQTRAYADAANLSANTFTRTGYTFHHWNTAANDSGASYANQASYPFTSDVTLYAQWTINQYTITASSSGNGTIAPATPQTVNYNATTAFTLTPDASYHIDSVTGTCGGSLVGSTFTTAAVTANCTVIANFTATVNINVSLPSGLTALTNTTLTIPVTVSDTTGAGVLSYDFSLTYDPAVLSPAATPYDTTGTLSSSFTVTPNSTVSGSLQISGYGTAPLSGAGTLIYLRFNVLASPPVCSAFSFSAFMFNEGAPGTILSGPGGMCVNTGNVSGRVTYGTSPMLQTVPNVTMSGAGSPNVSTVTDAGGLYDLSGFGPGAYTVTPSKTGDFGPGIISGYDASLAAQHAVNLISLNANQRYAADVSGNGSVTSFDAALIAQYVVSIVSAQPNQSGIWKFIPPSKSYANVWTNYTFEDYTAILKGDVSGNWTPTGARDEYVSEDLRLNPVRISLTDASVSEGSEIVIPVNVSDLTNRGVYSFDFEIQFDPNVLELNAESPTNLARTEEESIAQTDFSEILSMASFVEKTNTLSSNYSIAVNRTAKGVVRITGYGIAQLQGAGELLRLKFNAKKGVVNAKSNIIWSAAGLNEGGSIPLTTVGAVVRISQPDGKQ